MFGPWRDGTRSTRPGREVARSSRNSLAPRAIRAAAKVSGRCPNSRGLSPLLANAYRVRALTGCPRSSQQSHKVSPVQAHTRDGTNPEASWRPYRRWLSNRPSLGASILAPRSGKKTRSEVKFSHGHRTSFVVSRISRLFDTSAHHAPRSDGRSGNGVVGRAV